MKESPGKGEGKKGYERGVDRRKEFGLEHVYSDPLVLQVNLFVLLLPFRLRLPGTLIANAGICIVSFIITGTIIYTNKLNALLTGDFQAVG